MADYLLHLIGRKLTSGFCADDSAGSKPLMQKMYIFQKGTDLTRPIKKLNCFIGPKG